MEEALPQTANQAEERASPYDRLARWLLINKRREEAPPGGEGNDATVEAGEIVYIVSDGPASNDLTDRLSERNWQSFRSLLANDVHTNPLPGEIVVAGVANPHGVDVFHRLMREFDSREQAATVKNDSASTDEPEATPPSLPHA